MLKQAYGEDSLSHTQCYEWYQCILHCVILNRVTKEDRELCLLEYNAMQSS
jgi:hypothetical protein